MEQRGKCKAGKRPYMKLFTSDYRDGTARLSFELQGFYFRILTLLHDGDSVPSDGKALGVMLQCDPRKAVRLTRQLIAAGKLYEAEGELRNKRIDRDIGLTSGELRGDFDGTSPALQPDIDEKSERKIQKDESNQEGSKPYYGESHFHCHSQRKKEPPLTPPSGDSRSRGSRLPDDWKLPDDWRDWALTNCPLSNAVTVRDQADRFADYWRAQPGVKGRKTDWQATWRNWCRTAFASAPTRKRVGSPMAMIGSINGLSRF